MPGTRRRRARGGDRGTGWWLTVLLLLLLGAPGPAAGGEPVLTDDAHVSFAAPARNLGASPGLVLQAPPGRGTTVLLKFDLSSLPAGTLGSDVVKATLRLWVSSVTTPGLFDVRTVRSAWRERS